MENKELDNYINEAYNRWHDYATYHCSLQGMAGQESDLLNEVLVSLIEKGEAYLINLMNKKKNGYTELDFFVLRMIKMNAISNTAPYRHKFRDRTPANENYRNQPQKLNLIDEVYSAEDSEIEQRAAQIRCVRFILDNLPLDEIERDIAVGGLISGETAGEYLEQWGKCTKEDNSFIYQNLRIVKHALFLIITKLSNDGVKLFRRKPKYKCPTLKRDELRRVNQLINDFFAKFDSNKKRDFQHILEEII